MRTCPAPPRPCPRPGPQVKPGLPYLDVIRLLRDNSPLPIAAYHVSGAHCPRAPQNCSMPPPRALPS